MFSCLDVFSSGHCLITANLFRLYVQVPNCSMGPERSKCSDRLCSYLIASSTKRAMRGEFADCFNMGTTDGANQISLELLIPTLHQHVWRDIFHYHISSKNNCIFLTPRYLKKGSITPSILGTLWTATGYLTLQQHLPRLEFHVWPLRMVTLMAKTPRHGTRT